MKGGMADCLLCLDNHLRNSGSAQCFATDKSLALDPSKEIAEGSEGQKDASSNQAAGAIEVAQELEQSHDGVGRCSHVVGRNPANKLIELARRGANSQE